MRKEASQIIATAVAGILFVADSQLAAAQQADEQPGDGLALEEVTVTAQRRVESVIDVPVSMTVLNGEQLAATAPDGLLGIAGSVPNLVYAGGAYKARPEITMRGIFSQVRNIGFDASLGVYVDGVFLGRPIAFNPSVLDIEQVEVLRGPQGSLFGKNTSSGALNVQLKQPQARSELLVEAGYGNYDTTRGRVIVNLPLIEDKLFARFSGFGIDSGGYVKNLVDGSDTGSEQTYGGRAQFRLLATDNLEFNLSLDKTASTYGIGQTEGVTSLPYTSAPGPYTVANDLDSEERLDVSGVGLTSQYHFASGHELTSITAYREASDDLYYDNDNSPLDINRTRFVDTQHQFSQEVRIASPRYDRYDYVAGVYFFHQSIGTNRPVYWGAAFAVPNQFMANYGSVSTDSYAGFGQLNYRLTQALTVFAGLRATRESKDLDFTQDGLLPLGLPDIAPFSRSLSDTDTSPSVGLSYEFNKELTTYAKFSRGYKSGGFNADFISSLTDLQFGPESVSNYEVGTKALLWEERMRLSVALFYMDYQDMQVSQFNTTTGGFTIRNAGAATSQGVELDLSVRPLRGLEVTAGVGYTDAKFDEFKNGGGRGIDFDGNRLPKAPRYTANLALDYSHAVAAWGELRLGADYNYRSNQFTTEKNIPTDYVGGYGLLNARAGLVFAEDRWDVSLWARNLLDSDALASSSLDGINRYVSVRYVEPRTYGVNVTFRN